MSTPCLWDMSNLADLPSCCCTYQRGQLPSKATLPGTFSRIDVTALAAAFTVLQEAQGRLWHGVRQHSQCLTSRIHICYCLLHTHCGCF